MASNSTGKNSTGKWVERAATTGGGRTYRGQMPVNWYASLAVICIVGLLLIGFSRYQRTHQTDLVAGPPTTRQIWHAALGIDICGTMQPNLPASTNTKKTGLDRQRQRRRDHRPEEQLRVGGQRHAGQVRLRLQGTRTVARPPCSTRASRRTPTVTSARRGRPTPASPAWSSSTAGPTSSPRARGPRPAATPGSAVRQRPADHHGLRAGHRHRPQASGLGDHQPVTSLSQGTTTTTAPTTTPTTVTTATTGATTATDDHRRPRPTTDHGPRPHRRQRNLAEAPSEGGRPGGRRGHAPAAADAHRPQADAPDRGAAHDRAGHRPSGRPRDRRGRALPRLPARRLHQRLSRRHHRRGPSDLRRRARARSTPPVPSGSPPGTARHRRDLRGGQRGRADRRRTSRR